MSIRIALVVASSVLISCSTSRRAATHEAPSESTPPGAVAATEIAWETYEAGIARARAEHKPAILVFTATWCGQCQAYKSVLANPSVIALSQRFVMIQVDITDRPELNRQFAFDGTYVPRTMFLDLAGGHRSDLRAAHRTQYSYFLDPNDPDELLSLMQRALRPA